MTRLSPHERLIFPLDLPTEKEALGYVRLLKNYIGVFKVGLELFISAGPGVVKAIKKEAPQARVFLDLKFHDIPETVRRATRAASTLGVDFVTVHCEGGMNLLKAVREEAQKVKVLGVTLLTSLSKEDLKGVDPGKVALERARMAKEAGLSGVVCSGFEVKRVKEAFGQDFIVVVPGIRLSEDITKVKMDDQKRIVSPYEAVHNGADYIVVGRPIRDAKDPVNASTLIAREIERAMSDRK